MPRQFVLIHKNDPPFPKGLMDRLEQLARILASIALPLVLGVFGYLIQKQIAKNTIDQEYVKLAISILSDSKKAASATIDQEYVRLAISILSDPKKADSTHEALRVWAADIVNAHLSENRLTPELREALIHGSATFRTGDLREVPAGKSGWCYLGTWSDDPSEKGWKELVFDLKTNAKAPDSGLTSPKVPVDIRVSPQRLANSIGVLQPGTIVRFEQVQRPTSGEIWALVTVQ